MTATNPWVPIQKEKPEAGKLVEVQHENGFVQPAIWRGAFFIPGTEHQIYARIVFWREREV